MHGNQKIITSKQTQRNVFWAQQIWGKKFGDALLPNGSPWQRACNEAYFCDCCCDQSRISRTPYHPIGGPRCHRGPKIQSRHHFAPQRKLRSPKFKYEALEISEARGPFERKEHYNYFGPFPKQGIYTLQLLLGSPLKAK